ncbi:hypothetical protein BDV93DRAFT_566850 [Ceratobasidium sp. AG-I]|nr:hypothetical protein BDV93DRAFT_566850 [Ceratobasidium sp. AG-I]
MASTGAQLGLAFASGAVGMGAAIAAEHTIRKSNGLEPYKVSEDAKFGKGMAEAFSDADPDPVGAFTDYSQAVNKASQITPG